MTRTGRWAAVAAALIVAGCGIGVAAPSATAPATSLPSLSPTAAPLSAIAPEMQHRWVREPHPIAGLTKPPIAATLELGSRDLNYYASVPSSGLQPVLGSTLGVAGEGSIEVSLEFKIATCQVGDRGRYRFALSPSGLSLSVTKVSDACDVRGEAIVGDWIRAECPTNPRQWCLGDLDPGSHVSINYLPFGRWADWSFDYGRFAYTVPEGWTNAEDNADGFVLAPRDADDGTGVFVFTDPRAHAQGPECPHKLARGVSGSAAAIVAWMRSLPGVVATNINPTTIGGLAGTVLDLAIADGWTGRCPWDPAGSAGVPLLLNADHEDFDWGLGRGGRMRLYVLALEPGRALIVDIEAVDEASWQALLPQATPVVSSFEFLR